MRMKILSLVRRESLTKSPSPRLPVYQWEESSWVSSGREKRMLVQRRGRRGEGERPFLEIRASTRSAGRPCRTEPRLTRRESPETGEEILQPPSCARRGSSLIAACLVLHLAFAI